jgi:hypothetical protein
VNEPDDEDGRRKTANLAAAAVLLALAIAAIWLVRFLDERRKLEACLEAARTDCLRRFDPAAN